MKKSRNYVDEEEEEEEDLDSDESLTDDEQQEDDEMVQTKKPLPKLPPRNPDFKEMKAEPKVQFVERAITPELNNDKQNYIIAEIAEMKRDTAEIKSMLKILLSNK